jgi:hypothetical protein
MNKKEKRFVEFVKQECKKYGVKCDLRNTKYVKLSGNIKCSGWFDSEERRLVCSMNRPDSIEILAHEYCHLTQWVENIPLWKQSEYSTFIIDNWLQGKRANNIKKQMGLARDLELDNEKRTVKLLKRFELDVDLKRYVKKANAYVYFYNRMLKTRKWCTPENSPYTNEKLIENMPSRFKSDYSVTPKRIEKAFSDQNL